eukprot:363291-Chlamydomonas_euryale.AAC.2
MNPFGRYRIEKHTRGWILRTGLSRVPLSGSRQTRHADAHNATDLRSGVNSAASPAGRRRMQERDGGARQQCSHSCCCQLIGPRRISQEVTNECGSRYGLPESWRERGREKKCAAAA